MVSLVPREDRDSSSSAMDDSGSTEVLSVQALSKRFHERTRKRRKTPEGTARPTEVWAVNGVSFSIQQGEMLTLLGPSGCGKTTTLRCIAGLEVPTSGRVAVNRKLLFDSENGINVPPDRRSLGMVFQSYAIWPHLSVSKNVSLPLTSARSGKRLGRAEAAKTVQEALASVGLADLAERPATDLSGGQQQRLALARALAQKPHLMLLDEPLSNLDAKLRESVRIELKRLRRELSLTAVYVTHDQVEALTLSDRIVVMDRGRVVQVGKPREIYERPQSRFVAEFVGVNNIFAGRCREARGQLAAFELDGAILWGQARVNSGDEYDVSVRPENVVLDADAHVQQSGDGINSLIGTVVSRAFIGDGVEHVVRVGGIEFRNRSGPRQSIPVGTQVGVMIEPESVVVIPSAS